MCYKCNIFVQFILLLRASMRCNDEWFFCITIVSMNNSRPKYIYGQISKYTCLRNVSHELNTWGRIMVIFDEIQSMILMDNVSSPLWSSNEKLFVKRKTLNHSIRITIRLSFEIKDTYLSCKKSECYADFAFLFYSCCGP